MSYPSPNAVAADQGGPFYSATSSQHQQQQQQQQQQQHADLPNTDELEIAAHLSSHALASAMSSGPGGNMADGQDMRSQGQPIANHHYEQDQAHDPQIQGDHGSMEQMGGQYGALDGSMASRKRSKVSRACDECRRKKIKCDATGESGEEQCSSCKRVGTTCQFSRVPMKRGPSKGYIKELADRLNTLEGAIHGQGGEMVPQYNPHQESSAQHRPSVEFSPPPPGDTPRKRTYSTASGGEFGSPFLAQRQLGSWGQSQDPLRNMAHGYPMTSNQNAPTGQMFRDPNYSPNGLQTQPSWKQPPPDVTRPQTSAYENVPQDHNYSERKLEPNDAIFDGYYGIIHPSYPILETTRGKVLARLMGCPVSLREAFHEALLAAVRSHPSPTPYDSEAPNRRKAAQLLALTDLESLATQSFTINIVYLQTMLLLATEAENRPPYTPGHDGRSRSRSSWLGGAVGIAYSMRLHFHKPSHLMGEDDPDTDDRLARRLWWSLVIMDRWHASSTASPSLIPDSSVVVYPEDQALLGDNLYQLARLSIILGHTAAVTLAPTDLPNLSIPRDAVYGTLLRGELERFRESLPASALQPSNAPLLHMCYWHLRILVGLTLATLEPIELKGIALNNLSQIISNSGLVSPLTYQCTTLVALALLDLTEYEVTRDEAEEALRTLILEARNAPSTWDAAVRVLIAQRYQPASNSAPPFNLSTAETKHASVASQSLQRLADLATATEEGRNVTVSEEVKEGETAQNILNPNPKPSPAGSSFDTFHKLRELVKSGYLSVFNCR
ncbi:related to RGT1 Regulator of glucose-induced genes [Rhynchosporium agropyri]|uniref:Related to RGT1 Regulator of glucose-induced genes n=1 Tax=Rhynchosporium agropyri TaxID=914238 RepID=A0A1E1LAL1_9HELO|nr:related to RGT1 Regulator of glucose-induced genes [Rhynchosporium agropyri]